jgi:hypothetical protein
MYSFKWGILAAVGAFLISIALGFLFGVNVLYIFSRALIFAVVFFALGFGLRFLINSFFPELLFSSDESPSLSEYDQPGSRVNITVDNNGEFAVPELYKASDDKEMGNIEDLIAGIFKSRSSESMVERRPERRMEDIPESIESIDRMDEDGYNTLEDDVGAEEPEKFQFQDMSTFEKNTAEKPSFTPSFGEDAGLGGLPDLDAMAMAFSSTGGSFSFSGSPSFGSSAPAAPAEDSEPAPSRYAGNKPQTLQGDFNPKELAEGIRTVLSKDK